MFISLEVVVLLGIGTFFSLIWAVLLLTSGKYNELVAPLDKE